MFDDQVFFRIYFVEGEYTYYTDPYWDKSEVLEDYADYIEKYSQVAIVKTIAKHEIVMGSLDKISKLKKVSK